MPIETCAHEVEEDGLDFGLVLLRHGDCVV